MMIQHRQRFPTLLFVLTTASTMLLLLVASVVDGFQSPSKITSASPVIISRSSMQPLPQREEYRSFATTPRMMSALSEIDSLWQTYPYTAAALVCGFKASAADIVAQVKELKGGDNDDDDTKEDIDVSIGANSSTNPLKSTQMLTAFVKEEQESMTTTTTAAEDGNDESSFSFLFSNTDWKRNAAFITYGALYQGITQEYFYNHLYPIWFGTGTDFETVATKVTFTLLVQTTILTLPTLYASKAVIEGFSLKEAASQYIYDIQYQGLLQKFYILWGPVLCATFSIIPVHLRVTFIALVSFFWLIILSSISGSDRNDEDGVETTN